MSRSTFSLLPIPSALGSIVEGVPLLGNIIKLNANPLVFNGVARNVGAGGNHRIGRGISNGINAVGGKL